MLSAGNASKIVSLLDEYQNLIRFWRKSHRMRLSRLEEVQSAIALAVGARSRLTIW